MSASVELTPLGFAIRVNDDTPEGSHLISGGETTGVLIFHARHRANEYADAWNDHSHYFAHHGYAGAEWDLRQACKDLSREHGRVYVTQED